MFHICFTHTKIAQVSSWLQPALPFPGRAGVPRGRAGWDDSGLVGWNHRMAGPWPLRYGKWCGNLSGLMYGKWGFQKKIHNLIGKKKWNIVVGSWNCLTNSVLFDLYWYLEWFGMISDHPKFQRLKGTTGYYLLLVHATWPATDCQASNSITKLGQTPSCHVDGFYPHV